MQGEGFIINTLKFKENDMIVTIISYNNIISGLVKYGSSKKNIPNLQNGNFTYFDWSGRDNSLGTLKIEPIKNYTNLYMSNKLRLGIISSMSEILYILSRQITNIKIIYTSFLDIMHTLQTSDDLIIEKYLQLEALIILNTGLYSKKIHGNQTSFEFLSNTVQSFSKNIPQSRIILEDLIKKNLENYLN